MRWTLGSIVLFIFIPFLVWAQSAPTGFDNLVTDLQQNTVPIKVTPLNPAPLSEVTVSLGEASVNVSSAEVTWYVNGEVYSAGRGQPSITLTTPAAGVSTTVRATIMTADGGTYEQTTTIVPQHVTIGVQGVGYVPPFYKGATAPVTQGDLRLTAWPEVYYRGERVPTSELNYRWYKNNNLLKDVSGYGKSAVSIPYQFSRQIPTVRLDILDPSGQIVLQKAVRVLERDPELVLYEGFTPLERNQVITGEATTITAVPYFFESTLAAAPFIWQVNNRVVREEVGSAQIKLSREADSAGRSRVEVRVKHPDKTLQEATEEITFIYE